MPASLDRFSAHIDEPTVVTTCEQCEAEIYDYERYYKYEDVDFCEKRCIVDWLIDYSDVSVINDY